MSQGRNFSCSGVQLRDNEGNGREHGRENRFESDLRREGRRLPLRGWI